MVYKLDPELEAALTTHRRITNSQPVPEGMSSAEHARQVDRETLVEFFKFHEARLPDGSLYTVKDESVPVEHSEIKVRLLAPTGSDDAMYPVFLWFHGGGWVTGDVEQDDFPLRLLCVELQVVIVSVEYRCAPEHTFPYAFNDCYAALDWVANHASALRISLSKGFIVGGDSAGGNLAAAVALKARDDPFLAGKRLTGQYLREAAVCHPDCRPEAFLRPTVCRPIEHLASKPLLKHLSEIYDPKPPTDLRMSPLLAPSKGGLPAAFIQVMECDPLRDEGILYERVLREAGVPTKLVQHNGLVHASHYWCPTLRCTHQVHEEMRNGLKWLLSLTQ
ncbi:Alpha/Beta hydrolase protein [Epithele typhae]|uniref:Alpha/Beta hydrolase protein n=1 Tax=Epithele typhae TaxID=378194 RepID=UPI0020086C10|nr:Alpha/Beta hydrolase protein [Epithele typhae]KAH9940129.1 Alpha/Beta hydrolase protein [Epithele typhae]